MVLQTRMTQYVSGSKSDPGVKRSNFIEFISCTSYTHNSEVKFPKKTAKKQAIVPGNSHMMDTEDNDSIEVEDDISTVTPPIYQDVSLTDLLAATSTGDEDDDIELEERLERLRADSTVLDNAEITRVKNKLLDAHIKIDRLEAENVSINAQLSILNDELENYQKTDKKQKANIKKLMNENDNLLRDISKHKGIRQFIGEQSSEDKQTDTSDHITSDSSADDATDINTTMRETLDIATSKLDSLKAYMTRVGYIFIIPRFQGATFVAP